jgi:PAS domain S-box-containing protein
MRLPPGQQGIHRPPLPLAASRIEPKSRLQRYLGIALVLLGGAGVLGWIFELAVLVQIVPGYAAMGFNTALCFWLGGLAWLLPELHPPSARSLQTALGAAVCLLPALTLLEYALRVDLGIDWPDLHGWLEQNHPHPGRISPTTSIGLLCGGLALVLSAHRRGRHMIYAELGLGATVLIVGSLGAFGYLLRLDPLLLWYPFRGMSLPAVAGLTLLGAGLTWLARRSARVEELGEAERITGQGLLVLIAVALISGLTGLGILERQMEAILGDGLRLSLEARVQHLENSIGNRTTRAAVIANRPNLLRHLRLLHTHPDDSKSLAVVHEVLESFTPFGFSAIAAYLPDGRPVGQVGRFIDHPELSVPLSVKPDTHLEWYEGFHLRHRLEVRDADQSIGWIESEQTLPDLTDTVMSGEGIGGSGEMQLCQPLADGLRCFPSRRSAQPYTLPRRSGRNWVIHQAVSGQSGVIATREHLHRHVVGAYQPVAELGLVAALKVDTAELYQPIRRQLPVVLLMLAGLISGGSYLFHALVKPLTLRLVRAEQSKGLELRHKELLLRGMFEAIPAAILVVDRHGRIHTANAMAETLFGYPLEAFAHLTVESLLPERYATAHIRHRQDYFGEPRRRGMGHGLELFGRRRDGSEFPVDVVLNHFQTPEGEMAIAIIADITRRKQKQELIAAALREKEILLAEIHHRVKNNLQIIHSLLDLQAMQVEDPKALEILQDCQGRIQSMALIHQTLYQSKDFGLVDFALFLETLTGQLQGSLGSDRIALRLDLEQVMLPIQKAIPCGLIVNELVSNALKHAFPNSTGGTIQVELSGSKDGGLRFAVSDDGIGVAEDLDVDHTPTLGLHLVRLLCEQIGASLTVHRRNPTRFTVRFAP